MHKLGVVHCQRDCGRLNDLHLEAPLVVLIPQPDDSVRGVAVHPPDKFELLVSDVLEAFNTVACTVS